MLVHPGVNGGPFSNASGDELEGDPGSPAPDEDAQRELEGRVAAEDEPGPEHGRQEQESHQAPQAEDVSQADSGARDARGVEGEVANGRERREAKRGQRVGEERGPELSRPAEQRDDGEGGHVQRRDDPQGPDPLGARDGARVTDLARTGEVDEVEKREPAGQEDAEKRPQQTPGTRGLTPTARNNGTASSGRRVAAETISASLRRFTVGRIVQCRNLGTREQTFRMRSSG